MQLKILIVISLMLSCTPNKMNNEMLLSLKKEVLEGNISSYEQLSSYYFEASYDSLLPYSKIMADTFGYSRAYYDVFEIISMKADCYDHNLSCLEYEEMEIALNYFTPLAVV